MSYAIQAQGLVKRFGETTALAGVDLAARTGTVLAVLGPNGAGKITAVRILATLLRPDQGRATVAGYDVVTQAHQVRQLIALTGQYAAVDESLTGVENLLLIGRLLGLSRPEARRRAAELLEELALADDVVVIDHRRVVATGTPGQLKTQVGGQVLQVSPVREADLDTVVRVVTDLSGAAPDAVNGAVSARVGDPGLPPAILQRLSDAGVPVAELSLRRPSLDEAFFALTGHRTSADGAGARDDMDRPSTRPLACRCGSARSPQSGTRSPSPGAAWSRSGTTRWSWAT